MLSLKLMTTEELMELLKVNRRWVDRQVAEGKLPFLKVGGLRRFSEDEVFAYLARTNPSHAGLADDTFIEGA